MIRRIQIQNRMFEFPGRRDTQQQEGGKDKGRKRIMGFQFRIPNQLAQEQNHSTQVNYKPAAPGSTLVFIITIPQRSFWIWTPWDVHLPFPSVHESFLSTFFVFFFFQISTEISKINSPFCDFVKFFFGGGVLRRPVQGNLQVRAARFNVYEKVIKWTNCKSVGKWVMCHPAYLFKD